MLTFCSIHTLIVGLMVLTQSFRKKQEPFGAAFDASAGCVLTCVGLIACLKVFGLVP